jgi:uncharacterized protein YjbI with pentapeptide repeats
MKNFYFACLTTFILTACDSVKQISTNTEKSEKHLEKIVTNTAPKPSGSDPADKDTLDLLYKRISLNEVYASNVISDTTFSIDKNWFRFKIITRPKPASDQTFEYNGYIHASNPDLLYIRSVVQRDKNETKSGPDEPIPATDLKKLATGFRTLALSALDWQKLLVDAHGSFEGFRVEGRNFNYVNLQSFNFNNSFLNKDTLAQSFAISSDQLELKSNSFKETYIVNSLISSANFKNWNFVSDQLITTDNWFMNKINYTEFNDVLMRNIGIRECTFDNCIFRNTNYGSFKKVQFNKVKLTNLLIEDAKFEGSAFYNLTAIGGHIRRSQFDNTRIASTSSIQGITMHGKFTSCSFGQGLSLQTTTITGAEFNGGTFDQVEFLQDHSYIVDTKFINVYFVDVKFGLTGLNNVSIGDPNGGTTKKMMARCDFRAVKFGSQVIFLNINFQGCQFPPRADLDKWGVKFIGCENEPKL